MKAADKKLTKRSREVSILNFVFAENFIL